MQILQLVIEITYIFMYVRSKSLCENKTVVEKCYITFIIIVVMNI